MFTFKEFIVEVFDKPYPIVHKSDNDFGEYSTHRYRIHGDDGHNFHVHISHYKPSGHSEVSFEDDHGVMGVTGKSGHKSGKVMASVIAAVKHHVNNVDGVKTVGFEGSKRADPKTDRMSIHGRNKLYSRMASKVGGVTHDHEYYTRHSVPADKLRVA